MVPHANELKSESSPYLLQHANNPVWWKPFSKKAFELAKKENKLVVISIGYAACHWCHVMEHESFEDPDVADVMNKHYVCIKVDREERPDVDHVYIEAVQLMTGSAGWPLNVVTLPDGRPVWGGTYFRKEQWIENLESIQQLYEQDPQELLNYASRLEQGLKISFRTDGNTTPDSIHSFDWERIIKIFKLNFDRVNGGFGQAPKFMLPGTLSFLLKYATLKKDDDLQVYVLSSLEKMAQRGIFDQLNGGFSRYSTDSTWRIPHFEKMLYDNAQLLSLYINAFKISKKPIFKQTAIDIIDFISTELTDATAAFYSSMDADSINENAQREEGFYYTFTIQELENSITDFNLFSQYYYMLPEAEWEGRFVLHRRFSDSDFANKFNISVASLNEKVSEWKNTLRELQKKRKKPRLDDKVLTAWNALTIIGLLDAYSAIPEQRFLDMALSNAEFLIKYQFNGNELWRNYKNGKSSIPGFLEDYAWTIAAFIKCYEITSELRWLDLSEKLTKKVLEDFYDGSIRSLSFTTVKSREVFIQPVDFHDDVIPSSGAVMAENLFFLSRYFGNPEYEDLSKQFLLNIFDRLETYPTGFSHWLNLLLNFTEDFHEIAVIGKDAPERAKRILAEYIPNKILAFSTKIESIPLLKGRYKRYRTLAYLCRNSVCEQPTTNINSLITKLKN
ncbi:MAG TPA: thioredoxin domain-containing protein [Flavobacteriaceae bacterium]|nr:thioredoxin domain-containing protein [Flavobacteriaceae bacterium]